MTRAATVTPPRRTAHATTLTGSTWAIPILIAVLSLVGLIGALTGDGLRDVIAWVTLGTPIAAVARAMRRRRP